MRMERSWLDGGSGGKWVVARGVRMEEELRFPLSDSSPPILVGPRWDQIRTREGGLVGREEELVCGGGR
jgi:hypothetical protein